MVFFLMQRENFFQFPFIRLRGFIHSPRLLKHVALSIDRIGQARNITKWPDRYFFVHGIFVLTWVDNPEMTQP